MEEYFVVYDDPMYINCSVCGKRIVAENSFEVVQYFGTIYEVRSLCCVSQECRKELYHKAGHKPVPMGTVTIHMKALCRWHNKGKCMWGGTRPCVLTRECNSTYEGDRKVYLPPWTGHYYSEVDQEKCRREVHGGV
jgi:hypothetical protein